MTDTHGGDALMPPDYEVETYIQYADDKPVSVLVLLLKESEEVTRHSDTKISSTRTREQIQSWTLPVERP